MEKKENELASKIEKFFDEVKPLFEGEHGKGLLIMAYDMEHSEDACMLNAAVLGKPTALITGMASSMEKNKDFRRIVNEAVSFYRFKQNPAYGLLEMFGNTLKELKDELEDESKEVKETDQESN